ncbi:MAG: TAXI family TRAP transporter solute-binding subunit [Lachnospiraceae bacterium]|nr:TAXI family TRAP transporter solute-binding subunit [Lachnospiraceae bacterium]
MKKIYGRILTVLLGASMMLSLAACGTKETPQTAATAAPATLVAEESGARTESDHTADTKAAGEYLDTLTPPSAKRALCVGTGSSSGAWYIIGGGMANAVNLHSGWFTVTNEAASGGGENLRNLEEGNVDIIMLNCDMGYYYYTSADSYAGAGSDSLRSMIALPSSAMHIVVKAGSGIKSIADLKGKSVAVGTAGSGYESFASKVIASAGMSYDDMKIQMINPSQMADAMKNGQIDAFFYPVQAPGSAITELALSADIEIMDLPSDFTKNFLNEYVGYVSYTIPAGTYKGQDSDISTLATGQFIATDRENFTEDEMYVLMRDIFDNREEWVVSHNTCAEITDTNIGSLIVPLHAGAVKFYRERGVEIPKELIPPEAE